MLTNTRVSKKATQRNSRPRKTLTSALTDLNRKHFVAPEAGRAVVFSERYDANLSRHVLDRSGADDIKLLYGSQWFETKNPSTGREAHKPLGDIWLRSASRRQYEGIVFDPQAEPTAATGGYYNLWQGFSVTPKRGDWSRMQDHIQTIICSGDWAAYEYLLKYLALAVQHPEVHPQVAVVLRGGEGTGKGTFVEHFGKLFGRHYYKASTSRQVTGQFGGHLENVVVLFADEAVLADNPDAIGVLKGLITESMIGVEAKYRTAAMVRSYLHIFMASNSEWVVPAAEDARRFFVLNVSDGRKQDQKYFQKLHTQMRNGGSAAMLQDLLSMDLAGFDVHAVPKTAALLEQKILSLQAIEKWWLDQLENRRLAGMKWSGPRVVEIGEIAESYKQDTGASADSRSLHASIKKMLPGKVLEEGPQCHKRRTWSIPSLAACCRAFEAWIGSEYFEKSQLADTSGDNYDNYDTEKNFPEIESKQKVSGKVPKPMSQSSYSSPLSEVEAAWDERYGGATGGRFISRPERAAV